MAISKLCERFGLFPSFWVLMFLMTLTTQAWGREQRFKDYSLEMKPGDQLILSGTVGSVKLSSPAQGKPSLMRARKTLTERASRDDLAKFEALSFTVRREGATVFVEVKGPTSKENVAAWLRPNAPELHLELIMPPVPVEIALFSGQVILQQWKQAATITLTEGSVKSSGTDGALRVQIQNGDLKIENHRGPLEIDAYGARTVLARVEGEVEVTNFAGDTNLSDIKGRIHLVTTNGTSSLSKASGSLDFINGRGGLTIAGFEGAIKGSTDLGAVSASWLGEADVLIDSNQAQVTVSPPSDSGATLRLKTSEGVLSLPEALRGGSQVGKVFNSRLKGSGSGGTVAIQSKTGSVRVK